MSPRVLSCALAAALAVPAAFAAPPASAATRCGVERWAVKTLSDRAARVVDFSPRPSTVAELTRLRSTLSVGSGARTRGVETTTYRLRVLLVGMKLEADSDVHLVVADPRHPSETMIVEFPAASCVHAATPAARAAMARARAAIVKTCGSPGRSFQPLSGKATITGVGFFDEVHGQTGVAPNGIELHPALSFHASGC